MKFRRRQGLSVWLLITGILISMANFLVAGETAKGKEILEKYSQVRIHISSTDELSRLAEAGLVFDRPAFRDNTVEVVLNKWEMSVLRKTNSNFELVVDDLASEYNSRPALNKAELRTLEADLHVGSNVPTNFEFGSMGGYYTFSEVVAELDQMFSLFPNIVTAKQSIGTTIEGRDIWMVKISDNPNANENEEEVLYTALMHAREPQGMANVIYFMWYVLENYGIDPVVTFLVDNRELYFVPVINADGYTFNESTNPNGGGLWRKNRRDNGNGILGVDLNRNYDFQWGFNNSGSSPNPASSLYRGTFPASEPETQTMQNFAISRQFTMVYNYHAFGQVMNYPWGYLGTANPDVVLFDSLSAESSLFNSFGFGTPQQSGSGVPNGYSNDWYYGEQTLKGKSISWTVEAGTSFWPSQSNIIPFAIDNFYSNLVLANGLSGGMPPVVDITVTPQSPTIIPSGGGFLVFDLDLQNNTNTDWNVNYWNSVTIPIGEEVGPVGGFAIPTIALAAGGSFNTTLSLEIPGRVPPATYGFNWKVGIFTNGSVDVDSFNFTKATGPVPAGQTASFNTEGWEPILEIQETQELVPEEFVLEQNYPNPFNPATTISYQLPIAENVSLMIYDLTGRQVRELVNENKEAGSYTVRWDGRNQAGQTVATGLYIYQIRAGQFSQNRKMLFMK